MLPHQTRNRGLGVCPRPWPRPIPGPDTGRGDDPRVVPPAHLLPGDQDTRGAYWVGMGGGSGQARTFHHAVAALASPGLGRVTPWVLPGSGNPYDPWKTVPSIVHEISYV